MRSKRCSRPASIAETGGCAPPRPARSADPKKHLGGDNLILRATMGNSHSPAVKFARISKGDPVACIRENALHEDSLGVPYR
jgi:hypothetical protein